MLPHTELDNYKLQVQLLQEKLQRSEENRQKLENKLEHALHKRSEHEKLIRAKQRQKYQQFVDELEKRNERNRQLKQMLERIDQQTAALSARSERLRMMKMQYEMYFAKLVQSQTMRCIQGTTTNLNTAPTPIPVLLPTTAPTQKSSVITATPIKNNEHDPATSNAKPTSSSSAIYQCDASGNLIAAGTVLNPVSYALSPSSRTVLEMPSCNPITPLAASATAATSSQPAFTAGTQHWTLAMATPTPTGMLLTTTPTLGVLPTATTEAANTTADLVSVPTYDYLQYPFGYLPRMRHLLQSKPNTSVYSDESDDLLQPMDANTKFNRYYRPNKENDSDNLHHTDENNVRIDNDIGSSRQMDLPTRQLDSDKSLGALSAAQILRRDNVSTQQQEQQRQRPEQLLSRLSTTSSASSLTLDKLPRTMTMTKNATAAASTPIDERNNDADDGRKPQLATRFDNTPMDISNVGCENKVEDKGEPPTQHSGVENSMLKATTDDASAAVPFTVISNNNGNAIEADLRQKIDTVMPAQQEKHMTRSWQATKTMLDNVETAPGDGDNTEMAGGFREITENKAANNDLNNGNNTVPTIPSQNNVVTSKVSIEKIENEIYGELVNPTPGDIDKNDARNAAQGLVKELVTQQQHHPGSEQQFEETRNTNPVDYSSYGENEHLNTSTGYDETAAKDYDPTYATIEGTTNAEVYGQPNASVTYTDDQNAQNNYAQYNTDPNATEHTQDYMNTNDYSNYDAMQYPGADAYDPNAYPGYIYDEATGQYTPDPAQQYDSEANTAVYDTQSGYETQQYDASQENQDYDYSNYAQGTESSNVDYAASSVTLEEQPDIKKEEGEKTPMNPEATMAEVTTPNKPTSILSTTDKHATPNDAQKKKKRVNFVDSSETDDSSSVKHGAPNTAGGSESDFDFSTSEKSGDNEGV